MGKRPSQHADFLTRLQRRFRNARRTVVGWGVRGIAAVLYRLPRGLLRPVVRTVVGRGLYWTGRRAACERLARAFADRNLSTREQRRIVKASCLGLADALVDAVVVSRGGLSALGVPIDDTDARATIARVESRSATGWIGLTGHIGNWELLAHWVSTVSRNPDVHVIAKRMTNPRINRLIESLRGKIGLTTIYQEDPSSRAVRALRTGHVLGIVPDQDVKNLSGMFVDFLGRSAYTPLGPARLAVTAKAPIVCFFMLRDENTGGFRVVAHEPFSADKTLERGRQIATLTRTWSDRVADTIRAHPEQWPWVHDRWKTTAEKLRSRGRAEYDLDGGSAARSAPDESGRAEAAAS